MSPTDNRGELRSGRALLLATCVGLACSAAVLPMYSIGAFVKPLEAQFGWSRAQIQAATVFALGLGGLTAPFVGQLVDRSGARRVVMLGLAGVGVGFALAALMTGTRWQFYGAYGLIAVLGAGTSPVSWTRIIAGSFEKQRGVALGLALSGTGVCAILAPPFVVSLIDARGWRAGYVGLALLPVCLALPLAWFTIPRSGSARAVSSRTSTGEGLTTAQAVRSYRFWVLALSITCIYLAVTGVAPNLIPALTDRGLTPQAAAAVMSIYGVSIIVGRVIVGWLLDRYWAPAIAAATVTPSVLACWILTNETQYLSVAFAAALVGIAAGAELNLLAYLVTRYFGLRNYARIYGLLYAIVSVAAGVGPTAFAYIYDVTKDYAVSFEAAAVLFAIGGPILLTLARYPVDSGVTSAEPAG